MDNNNEMEDRMGFNTTMRAGLCCTCLVMYITSVDRLHQMLANGLYEKWK